MKTVIGPNALIDVVYHTSIRKDILANTLYLSYNHALETETSQMVALVSEITVALTANKVVVSVSKYNAAFDNISPAVYEDLGAYSAFDFTQTAIDYITSTYVLPLFGL